MESELEKLCNFVPALHDLLCSVESAGKNALAVSGATPGSTPPPATSVRSSASSPRQKDPMQIQVDNRLLIAQNVIAQYIYSSSTSSRL